jgi:BirA family biotin operon repressor/biotin-[acetyl-CoA-carboxylase] ligase
MLKHLDAALGRHLAAWDDGTGFPALRAAWLARALAIGEPITVNAGSGPVAGLFDGLDQDGALLLRTPTGLSRRFTYGDVTVATATVTPEHHRAKTGQ